MSGGDHTGTGEFDLDAIEARAQWARLDYQSQAAQRSAMDVPALVAEVRRLRAQVAKQRSQVEEGFARVAAHTARESKR